MFMLSILLLMVLIIKAATFLDALKFCFQTYFILDIKYSPESQHLWFLFQWELFNIVSEEDVKIPFLNDILQFKKE